MSIYQFVKLNFQAVIQLQVQIFFFFFFSPICNKLHYVYVICYRKSSLNQPGIRKSVKVEQLLQRTRDGFLLLAILINPNCCTGIGITTDASSLVRLGVGCCLRRLFPWDWAPEYFILSCPLTEPQLSCTLPEDRCDWGTMIMLPRNAICWNYKRIFPLLLLFNLISLFLEVVGYWIWYVLWM